MNIKANYTFMYFYQSLPPPTTNASPTPKRRGKRIAQFKARGESSLKAEYCIYQIFLGRGSRIRKTVTSNPTFDARLHDPFV